MIGFSAAMGVLQGGSFAVLALVPGLARLAAGTVLFGITIGNLTVLIPLVVVELFGMADYPRIYAVSQFGGGGRPAQPAGASALSLTAGMTGGASFQGTTPNCGVPTG